MIPLAITEKPELDSALKISIIILAILLNSSLSECVSNRLPIDAGYVAQLYRSGLSMDKIANELGTSKRIIANRLIEIGEKIRGYSDRYNTQRNSAAVKYLTGWENQTPYIMGYAMADGSISRPANRSPSVQFACKDSDRSILDAIANELGWNGEVKDLKKIGQVRLRLHGEPVVAIFEAHGVFQDKCHHDFPFPKMPKSALPHYIRGVLDGDGCVYHNKKHGKFSVQFLGTEKFIISLRDHLIREAGVNKTSVLARPGHWCVAWQTIWAIGNIFEYLYPNGEYMFLNRKKEKFKSIIS